MNMELISEEPHLGQMFRECLKKPSIPMKRLEDVVDFVNK